MYAIDRIRRLIRAWLKQLAKFLDQLSGGRITPAQVTITSTLAHIAVAWLIIDGQLVPAAVGLIIFGLMDALDGELARLQDRQSTLGIVLDATADRLKETLVYTGIITHLALSGSGWLWLAPLALGVSLSLSYIKAKGEAVLSSQTDLKLDPQALNRFIGGGTLMQFDVRMALLVVGLLLDQLLITALVIAGISLFSVLSRYSELQHTLDN